MNQFPPQKLYLKPRILVTNRQSQPQLKLDLERRKEKLNPPQST